ncbi:sensor histidine kinase [Laspinema olomoucense]|uniref:histidine kinase n=1 Tax=Laspinema olomoucense D3b TaxID=2953688 RepID=A0ABT2N9L6_9CYAN|nr:sensor histidine kinase [Laspinema sp. D3b]MCT7979141.1 sensor histidine kinase [Laspinema sp. D3b]
MNDFSELLRNKKDLILEQWIILVRHEQAIGTTGEVPYQAILDTLPKIIEAIASLLEPFPKNDQRTLLQTALAQGFINLQPDYKAPEIVREYGLARETIVDVIEEKLEQSNPREVIRVLRLIDHAMDEVIRLCFSSYTEEQLQELQVLYAQLKLTNQELARLVRASQENLAHLAHELKTPLTSIIGYSDLFLRQQRKHLAEWENEIPHLDHIEKVLRNGRQLLQLINDALEISRYESGQMPLHLMETNVRNVINLTVEMVEYMAHAKNITIEVDCDQSFNLIVSDPLRLQQVLTNLVTNAVRYTDKGTVLIRCQVISEEKWSITVSDTGIGIEEKEQSKIFEPYFRGAGSNNTFLANSTGLGLAIVSRLVKLLQGNIELVSEVNVGSTFTVTLPYQIQSS